MANPPEALYSKGDKAGYICVAADFKVDLRIVHPETHEEVGEGAGGGD